MVVAVVAAACWERLLLCGTVGTGRGVAEGGAVAVTVTPCPTPFAEDPLGISWCLWLSIFATKPLEGKKQSVGVTSYLSGCSLESPEDLCRGAQVWGLVLTCPGFQRSGCVFWLLLTRACLRRPEHRA